MPSANFARFQPVTAAIGAASVACLFGGMAAADTAHIEGAQAKIKHVIIIMQENRSFDNYFGTFPGADHFNSGTCIPLDPATPSMGCVKPFHNLLDANIGAKHRAEDAEKDLDGGVNNAKMDGFVHQQTVSVPRLPQCTGDYPRAECLALIHGLQIHDVMGYHTADELPNYWAYASNFVLQDHLFEGVRDWSLPAHLDLTSEWSAFCSDYTIAMTCQTGDPGDLKSKTQYPWATLFQLLDVNNVTWKYYLASGTEPDCEDGAMTCAPQIQNNKVPSIWNPAPLFVYVKQQGPDYLASHVPDTDQFLKDIAANALPQVSWIVPSNDFSEHPPAGITVGMEYVTSLVNAVMQSPYWNDTAIFLAWDDWGGFYDHVDPPNVFASAKQATPIGGYGLRVPGMLISAWAKTSFVDHQVYSFDSYAAFIEDLFINSTRLDPAALGNPDNRGIARDSVTQVTFLSGKVSPVGSLASEFDFSRSPAPPMILSTYIPTHIFADCKQDLKHAICQSPTVTVTWDKVTGPEVKETFTYHIQRDGVDVPACAGKAASCTDTPGTGTHFYRAYSVTAAGVTSPLSAATVAVEP